MCTPRSKKKIWCLKNIFKPFFHSNFSRFRFYFNNNNREQKINTMKYNNLITRIKFRNMVPKIIKCTLGFSESFSPQKLNNMAAKLVIMDSFLLTNIRLKLAPLSFNILGMIACNRIDKMTVIMRKIDCAHSRSVKMVPWPWFREKDVCIEAKIEKFWKFLKSYFWG